MDENETNLLEKMVLTRVMRLSLVVNGITIGLLLGLLIFAATIFLVLKGGPVVGPHLSPVVGPHLSLLGRFLPGYTVTVVGSFIGLGYGLILGFILGVFIAFVYNRMVDYREARQARRRRG
jgi:hypothetical protein